MGNLFSKVAELIGNQIEFENDGLEAIVEKAIVSAGDLQAAALRFETAAQNADVDPTPGAEALVSLADQFGQAFDTLSESQRDTLKTTVSAIYNDPVVEKEGEALFSSCVDFIAVAKELDEFVSQAG